MTYEEFLFNVFKVSAAEFNDIVKYIDEPLPLNKASGLYNFHHPLRIYTLFFDKILNLISSFFMYTSLKEVSISGKIIFSLQCYECGKIDSCHASSP